MKIIQSWVAIKCGGKMLATPSMVYIAHVSSLTMCFDFAGVVLMLKGRESCMGMLDCHTI